MKKITLLVLLTALLFILSGCATTNSPTLDEFSENEKHIVCDDVREKHVELSKELLEAERKLLKSKVNESAHEEAETICLTCSTRSYLYERQVTKKKNDLKNLEKTFFFCLATNRVK